ncbi:MAG: hypothetical protein QCI82_08815 [Candidatus Thermoplasmatota archaeon]|nr:hypothetical protein [Candidatus Thermoplasmatota archaeon]
MPFNTERAATFVIISLMLSSSMILLSHFNNNGSGSGNVDMIAARDMFIRGDVIEISSRVMDDRFQVYGSGQWNDVLIKGVNMGRTSPGHFPTTSPITYEQYNRWMVQIRDMNANCIRVFDPHNPELYRAINDINSADGYDILLFQGIWFDETYLTPTSEIFDDVVMNHCMARISMAVDIVHGAGPPGYEHDVSAHLLGIILGLEWDPLLVGATDERYKGMPDLEGGYVRTVGASPFEIWLASLMDLTIDYQVSRYSRMTPVSFVNTQSLDPIGHPGEPYFEEDAYQVHPDHIVARERFGAGIFSSYHVYPYYPEFMNLDPAYANYVDVDGELNNFAGYLRDLEQAHSSPVLIAEFGVPSSRGMSHRGVHGMDQGGNTEGEQGEINARMFRSIVDEGLCGGILFSWQDEWFKLSWNTRERTNEERSAFWFDMQTPEQSYGMLSFEPSGQNAIIEGITSDHSFKEVFSGYGIEKGSLNWMGAAHDESGLYIALEYEDTFDDRAHSGMGTYIALKTISGHASHNRNTTFEHKGLTGPEFMIEIDPFGSGRVLILGGYDPFYRDFGHYLPEDERIGYRADYQPIRSLISHGYRLSDGTVQDPEWVDTGELTLGDITRMSGDIFSVDEGRTLFVRIPWALIGFKDPSTKEVIDHDGENGILIPGIGLEAFTSFEGRMHLFIDPSSNMDNGSDPSVLQQGSMGLFYEWEDWDAPSCTERLKDSYHVIKKEFGKY